MTAIGIISENSQNVRIEYSERQRRQHIRERLDMLVRVHGVNLVAVLWIKPRQKEQL